MLEMINTGQLKLMLRDVGELEELKLYSETSTAKYLLKALENNPAVTIPSAKERIHKVMSGKYVLIGFASSDIIRQETNCTVDIIKSTTPMLKSQSFFWFYKYSKWIESFNRGVIQFQVIQF